MLTILPIFTPAAIPGLFVGCLIGNITGGAILPDIICGSLATLIGAAGTYASVSYTHLDVYKRQAVDNAKFNVF